MKSETIRIVSDDHPAEIGYRFMNLLLRLGILVEEVSSNEETAWYYKVSVPEEKPSCVSWQSPL